MEGSKYYSFIQKGSRNKSVNYRPVSLTSVICKLLETIIRDHMMDFYGAPFSHLFTELKISPIEVHISAIELEISPIQLKISAIELQISPNRPI